MAKMNPFDAPVPGESLTAEKGSQPFEKPPQFPDLQGALDSVIDNLLTEKNVEEVLNILDQGLSVEEVVKVITFAGFQGGKWTPDISMLMTPPLIAIISALASAAGKDKTPVMQPKKGIDNNTKILMAGEREKAVRQNSGEEESPSPGIDEVPKTGFLSPQGAING